MTEQTTKEDYTTFELEDFYADLHNIDLPPLFKEVGEIASVAITSAFKTLDYTTDSDGDHSVQVPNNAQDDTKEMVVMNAVRELIDKLRDIENFSDGVKEAYIYIPDTLAMPSPFIDEEKKGPSRTKLIFEGVGQLRHLMEEATYQLDYLENALCDAEEALDAVLALVPYDISPLLESQHTDPQKTLEQLEELVTTLGAFVGNTNVPDEAHTLAHEAFVTFGKCVAVIPDEIEVYSPTAETSNEVMVGLTARKRGCSLP